MKNVYIVAFKNKHGVELWKVTFVGYAPMKVLLSIIENFKRQTTGCTSFELKEVYTDS